LLGLWLAPSRSRMMKSTYQSQASLLDQVSFVAWSTFIRTSTLLCSRLSLNNTDLSTASGVTGYLSPSVSCPDFITHPAQTNIHRRVDVANPTTHWHHFGSRITVSSSISPKSTTLRQSSQMVVGPQEPSRRCRACLETSHIRQFHRGRQPSHCSDDGAHE